MNEHDPNDSDDFLGLRTRKFTAKGKEYMSQITSRRRKRAYKQWRKQLNRCEAILLDSEDLTALRHERNELETRFNELTGEQERLEDVLDEEDEIDEISKEYDEWERENQMTFKMLNNKIAELISDDRSSMKSSRRSIGSRSLAPSTRSSIRSYAPAESKIMKAARLDAELKFCQLESEKAIALKKQQDEIEMLKKRKELAITRAEINASQRAGSQDDLTIPQDENGSYDLLNKYLDEQLSESEAHAHAFVSPSLPIRTVENETETDTNEIKQETKETVTSENEHRNEAETYTSFPLSSNETNATQQCGDNENDAPLSDNDNEVATDNAHNLETSPPVAAVENTEETKEGNENAIPTNSEVEDSTKTNMKPKIENETKPETKPKIEHVENETNPEANTTLGLPACPQTTASPAASSNEALSRLADLLSQRQERNDLPRPEPDTFDGDILRFPLWVKSFETLIENRTSTPAERLYYLGRYTKGEAKEAIEGLLSLNTSQAYANAKMMLQTRFGNTFLISNAYRRKINDWPKIPNADGQGLRKFSDFLENCKTAMEEVKYLSILDDPEENHKMLKKLPSYLVSRWGRIVDQSLNTEEGYPPFKEFCKFLRVESRIACNPITSLRCIKEEVKTATSLPFRKRTPTVSSFATGVTDRDAKPAHRIKNNLCPLCDNAHDLDSCKKFLEMSLEKRKDLARNKGMCWGCLEYGHKSRHCRKKKTCKVCGKAHPTSLHDYNYKTESKAPETTEKIVTNRVGFGCSTNSKELTSHSLIVPVFLFHKGDPDKRILVYALLDEQSDACFIRESTLKKIGAEGTMVNIQLSTVLGQRTIESKKVTGLIVKGARETREIALPKVYTRDIIPAKRTQIPRPESAVKWPHLMRIAQDLMPYRSDAEVGILIGLNCASAIKPYEVIPGNGNEPYAKRTALGWGIIGVIDLNHHGSQESSTSSVIKPTKQGDVETTCQFAFQTQVKEVLTPRQVYKMFEMDFNEREADQKSISFEDRRFLKTMNEEIHQLDDGHYEMPLPFKAECILKNNIDMCMRRLLHLKKRFKSDKGYREDYIAFMNGIIDNGYAEEVPSESTKVASGKVWYIPHHGVYHPQKPGKIRVVFDCSAAYKGQSLNQQLLQGPDLTNNLVGVLCRFRLEAVAFMCDIEKMFFQVRVNKECRDFLRFLWWEHGDVDSQPKEYRMTVHLFGAVSSPGCANLALKTAADDFKDVVGSDAAHFVKHDFYVDDGLKSVSTVKDAINLIKSTKALCEKGGFHLHKFVSNSKEVIDSIPESERAEGKRDLNDNKENLSIERALGVQWCVQSDTLQFRITLKDRPFTRRGILATVSSVFDPLGMVSPVILQGKRILQDLCRSGVEWDERIPDDLRPKWEKWRTELASLTQLKVSRCYKPDHFKSLKTAELHHFSDASVGGYGQCSYLRLVDVEDKVHCSLVMAKSRVTPQKPITIPRLELSAALVSVKVSTLLKNELSSLSFRERFWTDSQVVLGYIYNDARRFHTFVANRVQQIRDKSDPEQWQYVNTEANPADHASRGLTAKELVESEVWWKGPKFLWDSCVELKKPQQVNNLNDDDPEVKRQVCLTTETKELPSILERLEYFSDWHRAKKAIALCLRLRDILRLRKKESSPQESSPRQQVPIQPNAPKCMPLTMTVENLQSAERLIIRKLQERHFQAEMKILQSMNVNKEPVDRVTATNRDQALRKESCLHRLDPFLDEHGLLRVGGRLHLADMPYEERHPLILPKESHVTSLIVCHFHEKVSHQGRGVTMNEIRSSGYWIVGGKSVITHHISKCINCRRLRSATQHQKMADLPRDRLQPAPPFTYAGVDCFGPWMIKERRREWKRYGVLFTCMASRAIHLEVVNTMETDSFISAYRRFVGRRGQVRQLRCDQGTNFVGAKNELKKALLEMDDQAIRRELLKDNCDLVTFKFNVPHASHMGGVWERQIRSVRSVMSALLDRQGLQLDDESLRTLMVEAEAIVNSRPLSAETSNPTDSPRPISPMQLLTLKSKVVLPPPGVFQQPDLYSRKRWRRVQYLANEFWFKWRKLYLQSLQQRTKWTRSSKNIAAGDIVLVKDESLPRNKWMMARVTGTFPDEDKGVRKAELEIADTSADSQGKRSKPLTRLQRPIHKLVLLFAKTEQVGDQGIPIEEP